PDRLAIAPADQLQGPARKALPGIVLPLAGGEGSGGHPPSGELGAEAQRLAPLGRPERSLVPLLGLGVLTRIEGRLAPAGEAKPGCLELRIGAVGRVEKCLVGRLRKWQGRSRLVAQPANPHVEADLGGGTVRGALQRSGQGRAGGAGQRDVALPAEKTAGRIEADPPGTG